MLDINNTNWEEKKMEQKNSYLIDRDVYSKCFGSDIMVRRNKYEDILNVEQKIMDIKLGVDTEIMLPSSVKITSQEKMLRYSKSKYNQLTLEYMNNTNDDRNFGDWFHLKSQIYTFCYLNEDETGIYKYWIFDTLRLMMYLTYEIGIETLKQNYLRKNPPPAKATFFAIPMDLLEDKNLLLFHS